MSNNLESILEILQKLDASEARVMTGAIINGSSVPFFASPTSAADAIIAVSACANLDVTVERYWVKRDESTFGLA